MRVAAAVTLWLLLVFGPARSSTLEIGHAAPDFTLSDQYGKTFHLAEQRGSVVVLLYADRAGAKYHAAVMAAIDDGVRTGRFPKPTVQIAAELGSAPGFVRGWIRAAMRRKDAGGTRPPSILLDWANLLQSTYAFTANADNVVIIDRDQKLRFVGVSSADKPATETIQRILHAV